MGGGGKVIRVMTLVGQAHGDYLLIQMHFRMHHVVVRFSQFSSPQAKKIVKI